MYIHSIKTTQTATWTFFCLKSIYVSLSFFKKDFVTFVFQDQNSLICWSVFNAIVYTFVH